MAIPNRPLHAGLAAIALGLVALGADTPKQTIDADGLIFQAPRSWKSLRPTEQRFRRAYLKVEPVEGDTDPAELVVTSLAGDGGGTEANIDRWKGMFKGEDGGDVDVVTEGRKGKNVQVTYVEIAGHYVAPVRPGNPKRFDKPNYRLLGAIVPGNQGTFFLKMTGPDKTMKAAKPAFLDLIKSLKLVEP